jgi:hypothetical protein
VQVALSLYAVAGRSDAIEALARQLPAQSTARLTAATTLVQQRKYGEALLLVEGNCAAYTDANAPLCDRVVTSAKRGLGR